VNKSEVLGFWGFGVLGPQNPLYIIMLNIKKLN
jgi:hypothetical protein